jgi:hypothetical protein
MLSGGVSDAKLRKSLQQDVYLHGLATVGQQEILIVAVTHV